MGPVQPRESGQQSILWKLIFYLLLCNIKQLSRIQKHSICFFLPQLLAYSVVFHTLFRMIKKDQFYVRYCIQNQSHFSHTFCRCLIGPAHRAVHIGKVSSPFCCLVSFLENMLFLIFYQRSVRRVKPDFLSSSDTDRCLE